MMKKYILPIAVFAAFSLSSCGGEQTEDTTTDVVDTPTEETCFYTYKEGSAEVRWTAFKTTDKVGVGGQFNQVNVLAGEKSTKITDVLETIKFNIPTSTVNTADQGRDEKLVEFFFGAMNATDIILGQVKSASGDNEAGTCTFYLTINNVEKEVTLDYKVDDDSINLTGEIDLANFGAEGAVESINKACEALHTGADGVSKTWPNVELNIDAKFNKKCH
jgi:polyisoprenoid-binding protein YceI